MTSTTPHERIQTNSPPLQGVCARPPARADERAFICLKEPPAMRHESLSLREFKHDEVLRAGQHHALERAATVANQTVPTGEPSTIRTLRIRKRTDAFYRALAEDLNVPVTTLMSMVLDQLARTTGGHVL